MKLFTEGVAASTEMKGKEGSATLPIPVKSGDREMKYRTITLKPIFEAARIEVRGNSSTGTLVFEVGKGDDDACALLLDGSPISFQNSSRRILEPFLFPDLVPKVVITPSTR